MELRQHPRMTYLGRSNWPPEWTGPYGPNNPPPRGEVGVLMRVERAPNILKTPHCVLVMQWNHEEYFGCLYFHEEDFSLEILRFLRNSLGRPIAEIGGLDAP